MRSRAFRPGRQTGFALIAVLLVVVAVTLASTMAVGRAQHDAQRDREKQLLWVGDQYRQALVRYRLVTAGKGQEFPAKLEDLLDDRRLPVTTRHIRQLYPDPMTGKRDWVLEMHGDRVVGLHSRSETAPIKAQGFKPEDAGFAKAKRISDWRFLAAETVGDKAGGVVARVPGGAPAPGTPGGPTEPGVPVAPVGGQPPDVVAQPPPAPVNRDRLQVCLRERSEAMLACRTEDLVTPPDCEARLQREFQQCLRSG